MKYTYIFILCLTMLTLLSCHSDQKAVSSFPGNQIQIKNFYSKYDGSYYVNFDVVNDTDSVRYILVSNWYLDGAKSRFVPKKGWPTQFTNINIISYIPVHPSFVSGKIISYLERNLLTDSYPTFLKLQPKQSQKFNLCFSTNFYKSLHRSMNQYTFGVSLCYLTPKFWELNRKYYLDMHIEINNNVICQSNKPLYYNIYAERIPIFHGNSQIKQISPKPIGLSCSPTYWTNAIR